MSQPWLRHYLQARSWHFSSSVYDLDLPLQREHPSFVSAFRKILFSDCAADSSTRAFHSLLTLCRLFTVFGRSRDRDYRSHGGCKRSIPIEVELKTQRRSDLLDPSRSGNQSTRLVSGTEEYLDEPRDFTLTTTRNREFGGNSTKMRQGAPGGVWSSCCGIAPAAPTCARRGSMSRSEGRKSSVRKRPGSDLKCVLACGAPERDRGERRRRSPVHCQLGVQVTRAISVSGSDERPWRNFFAPERVVRPSSGKVVTERKTSIAPERLRCAPRTIG